MSIEFCRDGPWEVPTGWVWARLGDVSRFIGRGRGPSYVPTKGVPVINQKCIRWHRLETQHLKFTAREAFDCLAEQLKLLRGDILWNSTGTGTIGRALVYDGSLPEVTVDSHVTIVRTNEIDPHFICYLIETMRVQHLVVDGNVGSTNQLELPRAFVQNLNVPIPPLAEQRRIVARIDELFTDIADGEIALTRARGDLNTWRRALLKSAVTGELTREWREHRQPNERGEDVVERLRKAIAQAFGVTGRRGRRMTVEDQIEVDVANLPDLPPGWCWSRIGEISHVSGGLTKNPARRQIDRKLPFLRVANVQCGDLDLAEMHEIGVSNSELDRVLLQRNDLLIVEGNGSVEPGAQFGPAKSYRVCIKTT